MNETPIHLVTFANKEPFIKSQQILNSTYKIAEINTHTMYGEEDIINTEFYKKNELIFTKYKTIGFGLYIWKPYLILKRLNEIADGEYLYYQDSSKYDFTGFNKSIRPIIQFMESNSIDLLPGFQIDKINKNLIQPQCLSLMGYSTNDDFLSHKHYHTSPMFIKKTPKTVQFICEWLEFCQIPNCIIKKTPYHQCDQAILNILLWKYGYKGIYLEIEKLDSKSYNRFIEMFYENNIDLITLS